MTARLSLAPLAPVVPQDRIRKELADIGKDATSGVTAAPEADSIRNLIGSIKGPVDSPYEGGIFFVEIRLPDDYPFAPPKMKFRTKVWHPNISSQTGAICLDILKDAWSTARTVLVEQTAKRRVWYFRYG